MPSISFLDSTGFATLTNGLVVPRVNAWTPKRVPIGPRVTGLGTGRIHMFEFRTDDIVSFSLDNIPGTDANMQIMLRLQAHLLRGGIVTLDAGRSAYASHWGTCSLAPDTEPEIQFSDRDALEYSFVATLRTSGPASGDVISPILPSMVLWLNPESLIAAGAVDGGTFDIWPDASGNNNDAVQATSSKRPTFREDIGGGVGAAEFDWTNGDYMITPQIINLSLGSTLILVAKRLVHVEHNNFLGLADASGESASLSRVVETNSGDARDQRYITYASGGPASDWWANDPPTQTGFNNPSGPFTSSLFILALKVASASSVVPYFNSLTPAATFSAGVDINKLARIVVGRDNVTAGNTGNNQIVDVALYDEDLATGDFENVMQAFTSARGITLV